MVATSALCRAAAVSAPLAVVRVGCAVSRSGG